ncbi:DedA family protein [Nocardia sp. 2]|uniref:DedA family protein n=1 Tax=Nocardia acididurans TaxID=2802282 RepID=A0ABS1LXI8_9NOCA|nr:DedA family protein [Nocardia acididurans]MBL1072899.1 DedA family protein [Nocardia acididurans]
MSARPLNLAFSSFGPLETAGPVLVWTVVLTFVFLECAFIIGLFLPGDSMLITAGVVLASQVNGEGHVWALSLGTMIAAIAGNQVGYVVGERTGHHLVARKNGKYINTQNLARVTELLQRHGFLAVLVARWIPWVRTLCPLVAGAAGMDHRRYTIASTIGAIIWAPVLLLIGYYAGSFIEDMSWLMPAVIGTLIVGLVLGTIVGIRQYRLEMSRPTEDFDVEVSETAGSANQQR